MGASPESLLSNVIGRETMQYVPRNLYRYRPLRSTGSGKEFEEHLLERLCNEICERRIYAAEASKMNDPFEGAGIVPHCSNAGSGIPMNLGFLPPSARDYTHGFRLIAMTERYDSPQMWAHYATGYCGVCLCFDTSFAEERISAVRYSDLPILETEYRADELIHRRCELAIAALLVKQGDWAYEQEWRIVVPSEETDNGFISFGDDDLWAVIIGHNTPKDAKTAIKAACAKSGACVYITKPQELRYRIGIWPDGFRPRFAGGTIEQELEEYCRQTDSSPFEKLADGERSSMRRAKERVLNG